MTTRVALSALAATLLALPAAARAAAPRHVPGQVLVKFRERTAPALRARAVAAHAHRLRADLGGGWAHLEARPGETVEEAIAGYLEDPAVEWAQPNFVYRASAVPTDPAYGQQWALHNAGQPVAGTFLQAGDSLYPTSNPGILGDDIDAERAWELQTDCRAAIVAVVDTGVNHGHQDLAANMWVDPASPGTVHGHDFVDGDSDPMDHHGHGTHVAGIVAAGANNGVGTAGVCWTARIMAVRVLDALGSGTTVSIRDGVDYARAHGASVINLSLGGGGNDGLLAEALDAAVNAGVVVVVAAGNEGSDNDRFPTYPCSYPNAGVLCVAALDQGFALADFSNYGRSSVDVGAPGTNVLATWAGTQTLADDPSPGSGWVFSPAAGGFAAVSAQLGTTPVTVLVDPPDYITNQSAIYPATADHHAWKTFDTSGGNVVTLETGAAIDVSDGDYLRARCSAGGGDPFPSGVLVGQDTNLKTRGGIVAYGLDVTPCRGVAAAVGLQLQAFSPSSPTDYGVALLPFGVKKLTWNAASYNTINGTSMATPVVAGIAALVRAYQPAFTPADVVGAVGGGGLPVPALAGVVRSGKAARALGALTYVNPPRGLTYTVH